MSDVIRIHGGPRQAEALENLVGLIEAGRLVLQDLGVNSRAFPVEIFDGEAMTLHTVIAAFNGSLDAAMALRAALLPGWEWWVNSKYYWDGSEGPLALLRYGETGADLKVIAAKSSDPARALLLASLRALRGTLA